MTKESLRFFSKIENFIKSETRKKQIPVCDVVSILEWIKFQYITEAMKEEPELDRDPNDEFDQSFEKFIKELYGKKC